MRVKLFVACLALAFASEAALAQTYTIKMKYSPDKGQSVTYKDSGTENTTQVLTDAAGKVLKDDKTATTTEQVYTDTVIAKNDKGPTKWKRTYEKAAKTENGKTTTRSYEGKTLVFEVKDGKTKATPEGDAKIDDKDLEELQKKGSDSDDTKFEKLLPTKAVKVGEKWTVNPKQLSEVFGGGDGPNPFDLDKSSAEGVLAKAYTKDGKEFGVLDITMKLAMKTPEGITADAPMIMEAKVSIDTAIDGSTTAGTLTMGFKLKMKGTVDANGQKIAMDMVMDSSGKTVRSGEK